MAEPMSMEQRKAILVQQLQKEVGSGAKISNQSDYMAVVVYGAPVNHFLHFFIGLFTFGLWWIVWILVAITGGQRQRMITVDEYGGVQMT